MSQWWQKVREFFVPEDQQAEGDDTEQLERQPKWSEQSQTSSNQLELPKETHRSRRNESSSLKAAPTTRKPRPVHRSATDTMRDGRTDSDDRGESRAGYNTSILESNSEEESSTAKLTRRGSVLTDLMALFRRSSSFGHRRPSRHLHQLHDEEESDELEEDEGGTQTMTKERLLLAIRRKKEHINRLRAFAWPMKKKIRTLQIVKRYIKRQQEKVSKFQLYKVEFGRHMKQFGRWLSNMKVYLIQITLIYTQHLRFNKATSIITALSVWRHSKRHYLIPWESKIKHIENHFGSVVSSYFTFLRWILYLNLALTLIIVFFIVVPEWLIDSRGNPERIRRNKHIKIMPQNVQERADELKTVLDFGGFLQYSYIFYGFYSSETVLRGGPFPFKVPVAYFIVNLFILGFSLFLILRKMASNARNSKLQDGRTEQYTFSWKVIHGWDYSLGNAETAQSLFKANVTKLKEAIGEYNVKMKQKLDCMIITRRIFVNIVITAMIVFTAWIIWKASYLDKDTFLKQNAVSIIVSFVTLVFPNLFELIGHMELFHPRFALRVHLARVFVLYVVAYYTLFASLFAMLNALQAQSNTEITTADAYTYNQPFSIVYNPNARSNKTYYETVPQRKRYRSRQFRQLAQNDTNSLDPPPAFTEPPIFTYTTTQAPPTPWTTVQSNYGPFGVGIYNPKVLVLSDRKLQKQVQKTVYESRPIGPIGDWNDATTQGPIPLNYTTSPRRTYLKYSKGLYTGGSICWETTIGQEITKVVITDLVLTVMIIMIIDFLRDLWVRYCVLFWCWNLEEGFPGYGEFKISENVLHLIKDQTMVWLGTMFVPLLPAINIIKLVVLMYLRGWAVMTCNVPAKQIFRASRSNNFYLILLLVMFLVSTVPLGYVIASIPPSNSCGPFAGQPHFYSIMLSSLRENLNQNVVSFLESILSPGFIIPVLLLLMLIIYFMFALIRGLREANNELSEQLTHERTEEKWRVYELAKGRDKANGLHRTGKQSPDKMGKIATAAARSPSHRSPQRSLKSPTSLDDFPSIHSPSKSPISPRVAHHPGFLPSLQSLKEDDSNVDEEQEEEERSQDTEQKQQLLHRDSSLLPPPEALHKDVRYDDLPPVKLNWKQKFMVLIGMADKDKLEAKLRMRQLAETAYTGDNEEPDMVKDDAEKCYSDSDHSNGNKSQSEKSSVILPPTTPQVRNSLLEEASSSTNNDYSDQPANIQRGLRPRVPTPATVIGSPKGRTPSQSPWSRGGSSRGTGGTDEDTGAELTTIINTGHPTAQQQQRPQSQRRTGLSAERTPTRGTPKHSGSPWLLEPEVPARRAFSMNDRKKLQPPFERDLASESSPLMEKSADEIMEEHKLSPQKRSPPSDLRRKRSSGSNIREFSLDPTPMIYQDQPAKPVPSVEGSFWDHAQKMHVSDDPTRPPSEESSFRDPTPSFGDDRRHQLRSPLSEMPDDLLAYANPYSSYAAAMCSPVMAENMASDPFVQRLSQPLPELSVTPEPQQMYPVQPTNFYGTPPTAQYPLQMPQPYYMQPQSPAAFTPVRSRQSTIPRQSSAQPMSPYYQQPMTPQPAQHFFPPPIADNYPMYDHTFVPYRTAPPAPHQLTSPIYQQYYPPAPPMSAGYNTEPRHMPLRAEPRNTSPSGGYITGSTNSPTPELGRPRFRISTSPPRPGKTNYASDSGQGSSDPSIRRWNLRQRGAELASTDSSSPERRSPNRQPGYSQQQTTV